MRRTPVYSTGLKLRTNHSGNKVKSHYETGKGGLGYGGTVLARLEFFNSAGCRNIEYFRTICGSFPNMRDIRIRG